MNEKAAQNWFFPKIPALLTGLVFFFCVYYAWGRCGSFLVDSFRDPLVAAQIGSGRVLYRDIFYEYGPLAPYSLAFFTKIFGSSLNCFYLLGAAILAVTSVLFYRLTRIFFSSWLAAYITTIFITVFAVKQYYEQDVFNYLLPYSYASIMVVMFVLGAAGIFLRILDKGERRLSWLWVIFMTAAFLCRIDQAGAVWLGFAALYGVNRKALKGSFSAVYLFMPLLWAGAVYAVFLFLTQGWYGFYLSHVAHIRQAAGSHAYAKIHYGGQPWAVVKQLNITAFFAHMVFIAAAGISAFLWQKKLLAKICAAAVAAGTLWFVYLNFCNTLFYLSSIFLFLIGFIVIGRKNPQHPYVPQARALFLLAALLSVRNLFWTTPGGLSFCFFSLGVIAFYLFYLRIVVGEIEGFYGAAAGRVCRIFLAAVLLWVNSFFWVLTTTYFKGRNAKAVTEKGDIFFSPGRDNIDFWQTVAYLRGQKDIDSIAVMPEGAGINFFTGKKNPLKYSSLVPPVLRMVGEEEILRDLSAKLPGAIVVTPRDTGEYGASRFGCDYAQKTDKWIKDNYMWEKQFGAFTVYKIK